jgi:hypothetical protein
MVKCGAQLSLLVDHPYTLIGQGSSLKSETNCQRDARGAQAGPEKKQDEVGQLGAARLSGRGDIWFSCEA